MLFKRSLNFYPYGCRKTNDASYDCEKFNYTNISTVQARI